MFLPNLEGKEGYRIMCSEPFPRSVFIESHRIDACMEYALKNHGGRVSISPLGMGFELPDVSFLTRFPWVEHLTILHSEMIDISAVSTLQQLRFLQISGKSKQALNLASFPLLRELRIDWWPNLNLGSILPLLRVLSLSRYAPPSGNLAALPDMPELDELDLVQSRRLTLDGIDRFSRIRKLEVSYFPNLVDLSPLSAFAESGLEILELANCPNLEHHDQVKTIRSLRRLAFNRCGEIPSLSFLDEMPALEDFSFVGTNVLDGNLRPCLRLEFAGFLDKRHYSHRSSDFPPPTHPTKLKPLAD